jgi:hypothetical protein
MTPGKKTARKRATTRPRTTKKKTAAASARKERLRPEFLILRIGTDPRIGSTLQLVGVSKTLAEAKKTVAQLTSSGAQRLAILEKKAVLERQPAITIKEVESNIVKG